MKKIITLLFVLIFCTSNLFSQPLSGTYWNGVMDSTVIGLEFGSDDTIRVYYMSLVIPVATYSVTNDTVWIKDTDTASSCDTIPVAYRFAIANDTLTLTSLTDTCTDRIDVLQGIIWFTNPVGLNELNLTRSVSIFPNPFIDRALMQFENQDVLPNELIIYDIQGRSVREYSNINHFEIEIDRGQLQSGIYFYHLNYEDGSIMSGSFMIE